MAKMTGVAYVNINGSRVRSKEGASLKVGGAIGEAIMDTNGYCGHATKELKPGEVKFVIPHGDDIDVTALQQLSGATVVFETDSGQRYLIRNAGAEGEVELKGKEVDITMTGEPAELM